MLTTELVDDLREMARQYFSDHKTMREAFEDEITYAQLSGRFRHSSLHNVACHEIADMYNRAILGGLPGASFHAAKARRKRLLAAIKEWAVHAEKEIAPTTDERFQSQGAEPVPDVMTKAAFVAAYVDKWPTVKADLEDAVRNGLSAARASKSGRGWDVQKALAWARSKGKMGQKKTAIQLADVWSVPARSRR